MQRGATRPLPSVMFEGKAARKADFSSNITWLAKHFKNQKLLPHPESDLGLLARVRLNLFSTVPLRRFTRAMNDRQKNPRYCVNFNQALKMQKYAEK
jgi:hypothetical protein